MRYSLRTVAYTILAIAGFVIDHMTIRQILRMGISIVFTTFVLPTFNQPFEAIGYFVISTLFYLILIGTVLPQRGLRLKWIHQVGEEKAFLSFEGLLAVAFFHNAAGLTHISRSTAYSGFWGNLPTTIVVAVAGSMFVVGLTTKIWSAIVVGIPIYYWKDMFLGRPVSPFVNSGPYKLLSNPMYGLGQLQVYAIALYYNSLYGLICGFINQLLLFSFYYTVERPFIKRVYTTVIKDIDLLRSLTSESHEYSADFKALTLQLIHRGQSVEEVATLTNLKPAVLETWIDRWNKKQMID